MNEQYNQQENELNSFTETAALNRFESFGIHGADFAFEIPEETDIGGDKIDAEITWMRFKKPEDPSLPDAFSVEGKFYQPKTGGNNELILFTPGFPGGNAGRFEQRYAKTFIDAGYSFFTIRHNGTNLLKPDTAPEILNSSKRMQIAQAMHAEHIGDEQGKIFTPADIVEEPVAPLTALAPNFKKIHLMGQSMGVAASYNTISRLAGHPGVLNKIGNIVGISGYIGKDEGIEGPLWDGLKMPIENLAKYELGYVAKVGANTVKTEADFVSAMQQVAARNNQMQVPGHIGNVLIFTPNDPLIAGPDKTGQNYLKHYGPATNKKLIIRDETGLDKPSQHSMLWISPENLLRAVGANISGHGPHYIKLPNSTKGLAEKG